MQNKTTKDTKNKQQTTAPTDNSTTSSQPENVTTKSSSHRAPFWADIVVMLLLFFLTQFAGALICNTIGISPSLSPLTEESSQGFLEEDVSMLQSRYVACAYFFAMILCFIALAIYGKWRGWGKIITFRTPGWAFSFRLLSAYILMWCFSIAIEPFAEMLGDGPEQLQSGGWLLVSAIFLAPLFEEVLFRGYIAGTLRKAYGAVTAWIISSILFGVAHGIPSTILTASFSGLILCYCYMRYRSLIFAIILHTLNNATACFLMSLGLGDTTARETIANDQIYWAVYALCLSVAIIAIARMWQEIKQLESNKYLH